jgi:L-ascorbate metabolism protein UlaG (beta-lactamase superfamily)
MTKQYSLSDHYNGRHFHNNCGEMSRKHNFLTFLKWYLKREAKIWPGFIESKEYPAPLPRVEGNELTATFVNHATVLLQTQGLNILTDPVWSKRVSPSLHIGPKRIKHPGVKFEHLPPIDIVLISHDHYDHLDLATLKMLCAHHQSKVIVGLGLKKFLESKIINIDCIELDWWECVPVKDCYIHFLPAKHWSGRKPFFGRNKTLWGSFAVESSVGNIYFAGDTAYSEHFSLIKEKFGAFRLSLLPIGAYLPRWFMKDFHIDPFEAAKAHLDLNSAYSLAIHFGTFSLSDEHYGQPQQDLLAALQRENISPDQFRTLDEGESWSVAQ